MYRKRFGLHGHPMPKDACGKTFYEGGKAFARLRRVFSWLADEPGLATLTGEAGVGKTAALRHLCNALPRPEHRVIYICDTNVTATALYRNLAVELGLPPSHRRDALWRDLKRTMLDLVDNRNVIPMLVIDEAQHLPDDFFVDLAGFLNYAFDSRDLLTVWLVGLPGLDRRLRMRNHAALATRIISPNRLSPRSDRDEFLAMVDHAMTTAGAQTRVLSDHALELLWRVSRGLPRIVAKLLRASLILAHDLDQSFVDDTVMNLAIDDLDVERPTPPTPAPAPMPKPRAETET